MGRLTIIAPDVLCIDVEGGSKGIAIGILAEPTEAILRRCDVSTSLSGIRSSVSVTCLARRRHEPCKFSILTDNWDIVRDQ